MFVLRNSGMLLRSSSLQVRTMVTPTAPRPKAQLRRLGQKIRRAALGESIWPAITLSRDDTIFSIQQAVFGYDRGGEGYIDFTKPIRPGKQQVPVRTGRKWMALAKVKSRLAEWYPPDIVGTVRTRHERMFRNNPRATMNEQLGPHQVQAVMAEKFGPFLPYSTGFERALLRAKAEKIVNYPIYLQRTGLTQAQRRKALYNIERSADGKGKPKKGESKRKKK